MPIRDRGSLKAAGAPTLAAFTIAVVFATTAWVSAHPIFTELFPPTCVRPASAPASPSAASGAILGAVVLAETASSFCIWSAFATLAGLWTIGVIAPAIWWAQGIQARGMSMAAMARA